MTTVYWAGSEEISFVSVNLADNAGGAYNCYRSNFTRGALCTYGNSFSNPSTSFPVALYATTPQITPVSQFWYTIYSKSGFVIGDSKFSNYSNNPFMCKKDLWE